MLGHHLAVLTLCAIVAVAPFCHWSISFFAGVIEFTNLPLSVMDLFKAFKELQKMHPTIYTLAQVTFCISFLVLRIGFWLPMFWMVLSDSKVFLESSRSFGIQQVAACYMVPSLGFLTGLQLFWGWKISCAVLKMLGIKETRSDDSDCKDLASKDPASYGSGKP
jgi:hypothetical protein